MELVRYEQPMKEYRSPVIFLAGPTVRGNQQHLISWRGDCIDEFERQGFDGVLILPEFSNKTESDKSKDWIPLWEFEGLKWSDCILFWIPRTRELIGLTTNFEIGYWLARAPNKVVYGRPDGAYRIRYLDIMWKADRDNPTIYNTMKDTVKKAIAVATFGYE